MSELQNGAFVASLKRNNAKIREDRATAIAEDAHIQYRRFIEDTEMNLKKLSRDRESMLDLSPATTDSLVLAKDFNSAEFIKKDLELTLKIRELTIVLEEAKARFKILFEDGL